MKKLLSLLLAALLCVCALTPVMAEDSLSALFNSLNTTAEAFPYTISDYQTYFNILSLNVIQVNPVWTTEGNTATAVLEGYGDVVVEANADGYVTKLTTGMTVGTSDTESANKLGMLVALVAMTSKATEDISFFSENSDGFTQELLSVLFALMGDITSAMEAPVSSTGEVYGDTVTFTLSVNATDMTMELGLIYEP